MKILFIKSTPILAILSLFLISACEMSKTVHTESLSDHNRKALMQARNIYDTKTHPETVDLIGKSFTVFSAFLDSNVPIETATRLHHKIAEKINQKSLYHRHLTDDELNSLLRKNTGLAQSKNIYMDSLTVVSVSDKDISNPLGNHLNVDNFLVFQIDRWPCYECKEDLQIRMKLRLIDAETGFILWSTIAENKKITKEESENLMELVEDLSDQMTEDFYNRFKKKWHRKRYDHLGKSTG